MFRNMLVLILLGTLVVGVGAAAFAGWAVPGGSLGALADRERDHDDD
ncbi:MAG: hypothetical protein HZC25_14260 [Rhodospirillales bacterium]|nr:hypothetical protein [Rhodospirillales bacterium]